MAFLSLNAEAQHPYYDQLLKDGRLEMNAGNLDRAEQFLEIAAFGLLENTDLLREIYIRLIVIQRRLNNKERENAYQLRLNRIGAESKPPGLSTKLWQEFRGKSVDESGKNATSTDDGRRSAATRQKSDAALAGRTEAGRTEAGRAPPRGGPPDDPTPSSGAIAASSAHEPLSVSDSSAENATKSERNDANKPPPPSPTADDREEVASTDPFQKVSDYLEQGKLKRAERALRKLSRQWSTEPAYWVYTTKLDYLKGDHQKVVARFDGEEDVNPTIRYYQGRSHLALNQADQALAAWQSLPEATFTDLPQLRTEAKAVRSQATPEKQQPALEGNQDRLKELQRAFRRDQADAHDLAELQRLLLQSEDWRELKKVTRRFMGLYPRNQDAHYGQARLDLHEQRLEEAFRGFYNLSKSGYRDGDVFFYGGKAAFSQGNHSLATYMFNRAIVDGSEHREEIDRYVQIMQPPPTVTPDEAMTAHIQFLEEIVSKQQALEPRLALLRLYFVSAEGTKFRDILTDLMNRDLTDELERLTQAWVRVANSRYQEALRLLENLSSNEARFLRGYLALRETGETGPLLQALKLSPNFPEVKLLSQ